MLMDGEMIDALGAPALLARFPSWMAGEQRRVFLLCLRMLGDADEADSAAQDAFFKAYQSLEKQSCEVDDPARWLTRIAVNTCLDRLRSKRWLFWRKRPSSEDEAIILSLAATREPDAEDRMFAVEVSQRLEAGLDCLSPRQRAVFTLRHYEDQSLEEIAGNLGLDVGTVKAHLSRALTKLRRELQDLYDLSARGAGRKQS